MNSKIVKRSAAQRDAKRRGLVLVAAVGVLGVLSVMGMAFATVMRLEARAARNFTEAVRADFAARAGVEDAIARLRSMVRDGTEAPYDSQGRVESWYTWRGTAGGSWKISFPSNEAVNALDDDGDGRIDAEDSSEEKKNELSYTDWVASSHVAGGDTYTLRVQDAASKVNVNAGDNLGVILDNLCRVIGAPLVAANQRALVPKWFSTNRNYRTYGSSLNAGDVAEQQDFFYRLQGGRPVTDDLGLAVYGDGYGIAGYRARHGAFLSIEDVRQALTWVERTDGDEDGDPEGPEADTPEERMEVEAKYAAIRPYITIDSWTDTDQVGYGKFENVSVSASGTKLTDRNKTWNIKQDGFGELRGCYVAIINGIGQGQYKEIANNTIDTLELSNSHKQGSEMTIPPNQESSYIIVGKDHRYDSKADEWYNEAKLYAKEPLSFHRAPVNVNTATDRVLTALILGLQTNWGKAGYGYASSHDLTPSMHTSHWHSLCPSIISVGRDDSNAYLNFALPCPNKNTMARALRDDNLNLYGHGEGLPPYCFFCNYGKPISGGAAGMVSEAHYIAWQILKEREQTETQDKRSDRGKILWSNGFGPFKGWDDLYFRVFRPWERASEEELNVPRKKVLPRALSSAATAESYDLQGFGHPGIARLCMANFNSNTDILKFQPNLEWINRWGPNFTELYMPRPKVAYDASANQAGQNLGDKDSKLRIRPGELLDKSDLNVGTTEFCFDSGGVYEVESIGRVYDEVGVVAEKRYAALIRIYNVWRESTQREFVAGTIMPAVDKAGTSRAGQIAVDNVTRENKGGVPGAAMQRKALCTYPEPIVPGHYRTPQQLELGFTPPLALADNLGTVVKPAGYDGQILLATNMMLTSRNDLPADDQITFFCSFTGSVAADHAESDPKPVLVEDPDNPGQFVLPMDEVGLLGAANSVAEDMALTEDWDQGLRRNVVVEGEGRGGDLRPDGAYFGVTKADPPPQDGSIEWTGGTNSQNINWNQGTVTMWVKPNWHHGTYIKATLPVNYRDTGLQERGSTVCVKYWGSHWPMFDVRKYSETQRSMKGYVRDRFEHEFFNGAQTSAMGGAWNMANGFQMRKNGDLTNTTGDGDMPEGGPDGSSPFGALHLYFENAADQDFCGWIPGWTIPFERAEDPFTRNTQYIDKYRPFYQMCPFRWFFVGFTWNYFVQDRPTMDKWGHVPFGQLREESNGNISISSGATWGVDPREGSTREHHLSLMLQGRPFVDTMRFWNRESTNFEGESEEEMMQSWAYAEYGSTYQWGSFPFGAPPGFANFGINRAAPEGGNMYQRVCSGTYATVDEFAVSRTWRDSRDDSVAGRFWPEDLRRKIGRYYLEKDSKRRPWFLSQTLFSSEEMGASTFTRDEEDEVIELGSVRWYAFTPHYALDPFNKPIDLTETNYRFPFDVYFLDKPPPTSARASTVTQSVRPGPYDWQQGTQSRNSSQRGCTVAIECGASALATNKTFEYFDPEAWSPILAAQGTGGQHARATPAGLRYKVTFGWSDDEYRDIKGPDAVCVDSPVFDDITITYMRRPKVLVWREVSE